MRLLNLSRFGELTLTEYLDDHIPPYAILSHTWLADTDEVIFTDFEQGHGLDKAGYAKIEFCGQQARKDGIEYFWVDTCCINKANHSELSEAITSMFRWYRNAVKCYVYMTDVSTGEDGYNGDSHIWMSNFRSSRWFTRGWTLQELLGPRIVEFFSRERHFLGTKASLIQQINEITGIPITALEGAPLSRFPVDEKLRWAAQRRTKRTEDKAYCLLGIMGVYMYLNYGEADNAFYRLQEEIKKRFGNSEIPNHAHWCIPRSANPLFTGREELVQSLDRTIRNVIFDPFNSTQHRVVISGIGGQGKSEICLQIAHRLRYLFWAVMWIDVSTSSIAERSFVDTAQKLSIPVNDFQSARLEISNLKHPWLLILDNADDADTDYHDYFPDGSLGVVMLTSRNTECHQYATMTPIALEGLQDADACDLLLKASRVPQGQYDTYAMEAQAVASLLQSHALALIQAGAYISRGHCTLSQYPIMYKRQRQQLLTFRPTQAKSRYGDVYTTFEVSVDTFKATNTQAAKDALQLLPLLAMCGPNRFPLTVFERARHGARILSGNVDSDARGKQYGSLTLWHASQLPSFVDRDETDWNPFRLMQAVHLLKSYSLISSGSDDNGVFVSMHPLVHAWANDRQTESMQHTSWTQIACTVALTMLSVGVTPQYCRRLQAHVESLLDHELKVIFATEAKIPITQALVRLGQVMLHSHADKRLSTVLRRIFKFLGLDSSNVEPNWVNLYQLWAVNRHDRGDNATSLSLMRQIVDIQEQRFTEDHPDRLLSQHELGWAYYATGQVEEAIDIFERVVKLRQQVLSERDADLLLSQHELALAYMAHNKTKEAVTLLEHVVEVEDQALSEDHLERLSSQRELVKAYGNNGQIIEAVALLERVVEVERRILAEDDPDFIWSQQKLAEYRRSLGDQEHSIAMTE